MSKVNKPKFKIYSKLGLKLTDNPKLKSQKLSSKKWQILFGSNYKPKKETEYGSLLRSKQELKTFYGSLKDKQLNNLFIKAKKYKGNQTINLIKLLERRLDIFLYRCKLSPSIHEIRHLIQHGHFSLNNNIIKISSIILKPGDSISVNLKSKSFIKLKMKNYLESLKKLNKISKKSKINKIIKDNSILFTPNYIEFNTQLLKGKLIELPRVEDISYPFNPNLTSLTEYFKYKKKL